MQLPNGSHLVAFSLRPFDCPADNEVIVKGCRHYRNPELAISEIHHEGQENIHQRVFTGFARKRNDKLKNKRGIGENPDQAVGTGNINIDNLGQAKNQQGIGDDDGQEKEVIQAGARKEFQKRCAGAWRAEVRRNVSSAHS